jgi:hypothetical protein
MTGRDNPEEAYGGPPVRPASPVLSEQSIRGFGAAVAAALGGPELRFRRRAARLLQAAGWRRVRLLPGDGDLKPDILGYTPDGRRFAARCRVDAAGLTVAGVRRFVATARRAYVVDLVLVVTRLPAAGLRAAVAQDGIIVADEEALARWAAPTRRPAFRPTAKG